MIETVLKEDSIIMLSKNVLKRFEHNIHNGVLFLFNTETEDLWTGNDSSNDLISLIDGKRTLREIYTTLQTIFEGYSYEELKESFDSLIINLIDRNFLTLKKSN